MECTRYRQKTEKPDYGIATGESTVTNGIPGRQKTEKPDYGIATGGHAILKRATCTVRRPNCPITGLQHCIDCYQRKELTHVRRPNCPITGLQQSSNQLVYI